MYYSPSPGLLERYLHENSTIQSRLNRNIHNIISINPYLQKKNKNLNLKVIMIYITNVKNNLSTTSVLTTRL